MAEYICDVDGVEVEVEAASSDEAAEEAVKDIWCEDLAWTLWLRVRVRPALAGGTAWEEHKIPVHPTPAPCVDGRDHDWDDPVEVVGGIPENPGVWGHGGGVIIRLVCRRCGRYRIEDTWGQAPWGEQGLTIIRYEDADERSRKWVESLSSEEGNDE
jgi:hypothetical protein